MKTKFEVVHPDLSALAYLCMGGAILLSTFLAITDPDGFGLTGFIVVFSIFIVLSLPLILISKVFEVSVNFSKVTVRTSLGLKYYFDMSEVIYIEKRVPKKNEGFERLFIRTPKRTLKLVSNMPGYQEMLEYLSENGNMANSRKIVNRYNVFYSREVFTK
ncbi:MAG: hypothetical protein LBC96_06835 [Lachnospiraceae bacterium]|jgi:hypothetical protein|nr:hypothetical protein [Lachnospiraceae bacterium]